MAADKGMPERVRQEAARRLGMSEILDEHEKRKKKYQDRDDWYDKLLTYYEGENGSGSSGLPILAANAQGRPLLRPVGESIKRGRAYTSQRLAPIVDDYSALLGRMPHTRSEPMDESEQGEAKAEKLTKFLYSTHELSRMEFQQAQAGFWLSGLGDAVYLIEPDPDLLRAVWNVANPRLCWPSFYHGYRRFEVYDIIVSDVWSEDELRNQLGIRPENDKPETCTVITYISPYQRTLVVGLKHPIVAANVEWELEKCPVVWVFNKVTGLMGASDIASSLTQQDFLDFCLNVWADGIVHMTYPIIGVRNPINVDEAGGIIGPGAPPINLQGDGDIIVRNTQADPTALEKIIGQTLQDINAATGTSELRQEGQIHASIQTGRLAHALQGPQSTRIEFKQQVLGAAIQAANSLTLMLQERAPVLNKFKGPIFGRHMGRGFQEQFDASQDIGGWYRNRVQWESLVGMNLQQKAAVAAEGLSTKLWDDLEARRIAGVEDPMGMRRRIESQMRAEMRLQSEMQPQQGGQPGGPGGAQSGAQPPGGQQQGQVPPMLFQPPSMGGGQPGGPSFAQQSGPPGGIPFGATLPSVKQALEKLADRLRGGVWAVGELAIKGQSEKPELKVSDSRDYSTVLEAVRAMSQQARVRQQEESKLPPEAVRLV